MAVEQQGGFGAAVGSPIGRRRTSSLHCDQYRASDGFRSVLTFLTDLLPFIHEDTKFIDSLNAENFVWPDRWPGIVSYLERSRL